VAQEKPDLCIAEAEHILRQSLIVGPLAEDAEIA